jgi:hypothetical protein
MIRSCEASIEEASVIKRSAVGISSENEVENHIDQETVAMATGKDYMCNTVSIGAEMV